jgi:tetratricopeptide (TPR) repeat protein
VTAPPAARPPEARVRTIAVGVCLVVAILAVYGQTAWFDFVRYDDPVYVTRNDTVRAGLTLDGFRWSLTATHGANWHPITWWSHMLDAELYGDRAGGHHLTSVLLHVLNTLLLYGILRRATGDEPPSALVAALFALHPLHVESVAWISERKDVLSTLFGLLAIAAWIAWVRRGGALRYAATLALHACSLAAKPMLVTLPFVLLLVDVWPLGRLGGAAGADRGRRLVRLAVEKLPFLALSVASSAVTLAVQERNVAPEEAIPLAARVANAVVSYVRYLGKTMWPMDLSVLYPHPSYPGGTPWETWQVAGAAAILVVLTVAVVASRRGYALVGWAWYLGTLVPVIGIVQVGHQAMADRYTYVPSIGLFVVAVWAATEVARGRHATPALAVLAASVMLAAYAGLAWQQTRRWSDSIALFRHSLAVAPDPPALHNNLANALAEEGRMDEAMHHWAIALRIYPGYARAHNNVGVALLKHGRVEQAIEHFRRAVALDPGYEAARRNLDRALAARGRR